jgi:hypothetical protein
MEVASMNITELKEYRESSRPRLIHVIHVAGVGIFDTPTGNLEDIFQRIAQNHLRLILKRPANRVDLNDAAQSDPSETLRKCLPSSEVCLKTRVVERALAFAASVIPGDLLRRRIESETARELVASMRVL